MMKHCIDYVADRSIVPVGRYTDRSLFYFSMSVHLFVMHILHPTIYYIVDVGVHRYEYTFYR